MLKIIKPRYTLFFALAVIVFAAAASLLIFNPLKAQPRAGANACTTFNSCLINETPSIGQLNGKFCSSSGEKLSDSNCACYPAQNQCVQPGYKCTASNQPNHLNWGYLQQDNINCSSFVCVVNQCTSCNQSCNSTGDGYVYNASCSSLCTLSYVNNQMTTPQDASFWLKNDGKLGPDDNNYIYFDPTVSNTSQNGLYVASNNTSGSFIKLEQPRGTVRLSVDKNGNMIQTGALTVGRNYSYYQDTNIFTVINDQISNPRDNFLQLINYHNPGDPTYTTKFTVDNNGNLTLGGKLIATNPQTMAGWWMPAYGGQTAIYAKGSSYVANSYFNFATYGETGDADGINGAVGALGVNFKNSSGASYHYGVWARNYQDANGAAVYARAVQGAAIVGLSDGAAYAGQFQGALTLGYYSGANWAEKINIDGLTGNLTMQGMLMVGSAALNLNQAAQNLIFGNIDTASVGSLLLLQTENVDKFKVDKSGNTTMSGNLTVTGNRINNANFHSASNKNTPALEFNNGNVIIRLGQ